MDYVVENLINKYCTHFTVLANNFAAPDFFKDDVLFLREMNFVNCCPENEYLFVFEDNICRICAIKYEPLKKSRTLAIKIVGQDQTAIFVHRNVILGIYEIVVKVSDGTALYIKHNCKPIHPKDFMLYHAIHPPANYFNSLPVIQSGYTLFPKKPLAENALLDIYIRMLNLPLLFLKRVTKFYDKRFFTAESLLHGHTKTLSDRPQWEVNLTVAELAYTDLAIFQRYLRRIYKVKNPPLIYETLKITAPSRDRQ